MATLILKQAMTGVTLEIVDIELEEITPQVILDQLLFDDILPRNYGGESYVLLRCNKMISYNDYDKPLSQIGVNDGDELIIAVKVAVG